jgi:hypothetical protein
MKEITIDEVALISAEIHEAASRLGCTHVRITGRIFPGGQSSGPEEKAARFVEYSWFGAVLLGAEAVLEETEPARYRALLAEYGLGDPEEETNSPAMSPVPTESEQISSPVPKPQRSAERVALTLEVLPATLTELERQAAVRGLPLGELLDEKCAFELRYR